MFKSHSKAKQNQNQNYRKVQSGIFKGPYILKQTFA